MKRKLLTVLLAVVMVFGVFGLTACGGSNPADDYNYYRSTYSSMAEEEDVFRIRRRTQAPTRKRNTTVSESRLLQKRMARRRKS